MNIALRERRIGFGAVVATLALQGSVLAQPAPPPQMPTVTVSASATATVANDKLQAWLRAEAENANPAQAASDVNAQIAKALARGKAASGVTIATAGYSTQQISDKAKPSRWRVSQMITVESNDFTAAATLITRLQEDDGLLLSGMSFSLSNKARQQAEQGLTKQAIANWQERAAQAAAAFGFGGWRTGRVTVQASDAGHAYPMMRAAAAPMSASGAPVAVEAGNTDVTVSVSGEALLDAPKPR